MKIKIKTEPEYADELIGRLYDLGITGVEIDDPNDFDEFVKSKQWDYIDEGLLQKRSGDYYVTAYVTNNEYGMSILRELQGDIKTTIVKEEDWENSWKQYFKPIEIGEKMLIVPEWEVPPSPTSRIVFRINPGMSFGTGSHATTRLCIEELEKQVKDGVTVLDLGMGSGILSVISVLLGAKKVTAMDVDPNCVKIVRANAKLNGVDESRLHALCANALNEDIDQKFDVVVSNIVADVIIELSPRIPSLIKDGGVYIASGIITERIDEVLKVMTFGEVKVRESEGWAVVTVQRI